ncbi:MAG: YqgE/AlgH family protein [Nocardioides sp.]|nr:YqgE/AlgH family protein [Nocardioides sp.]
MTSLHAGMLLVATPALADPHFAATVVLLLDVEDGGSEHSGGALGVVLNRPSGVPVREVLGPWSPVVDEPEVLFQGGPVSTEGALAVALLRDEAAPPVGFRTVEGRLGLVDLDTPVELVEGSLAGLRIFAGYAGWGAGQLDAEVQEGSWYVVPGEVVDPFRVDSSLLWRDVLRRQPGELAWNSTRPRDPNAN